MAVDPSAYNTPSNDREASSLIFVDPKIDCPHIEPEITEPPSGCFCMLNCKIASNVH